MPRKGCTHSRNPKSKKCRSKVEHDSKMKAFRKRVSASAKGKITSALGTYAMQLRKKRKSKMHDKYFKKSPLVTTRL